MKYMFIVSCAFLALPNFVQAMNDYGIVDQPQTPQSFYYRKSSVSSPKSVADELSNQKDKNKISLVVVVAKEINSIDIGTKKIIKANRVSFNDKDQVSYIPIVTEQTIHNIIDEIIDKVVEEIEEKQPKGVIAAVLNWIMNR